MLKYIQIDTLFEALQIWMKSILVFVGIALVLLIIFNVVIKIPRILDATKQIWKKRFFLDDEFLTGITKGISHAILGIVIVFFSAGVTEVFYRNHIDVTYPSNSYSRLQALPNLQYSPVQKEWIVLITKFVDYGAVFFNTLLIIAGIFFMFWSVASFFQKVSYFFFTLCFFWYLWSVSGDAYVSLSKLLIEDLKPEIMAPIQ